MALPLPSSHSPVQGRIREQEVTISQLVKQLEEVKSTSSSSASSGGAKATAQVPPEVLVRVSPFPCWWALPLPLSLFLLTFPAARHA